MLQYTRFLIVIISVVPITPIGVQSPCRIMCSKSKGPERFCCSIPLIIYVAYSKLAPHFFSSRTSEESVRNVLASNITNQALSRGDMSISQPTEARDQAMMLPTPKILILDGN
jgi:hypothetical protein